VLHIPKVLIFALAYELFALLENAWCFFPTSQWSSQLKCLWRLQLNACERHTLICQNPKHCSIFLKYVQLNSEAEVWYPSPSLNRVDKILNKLHLLFWKSISKEPLFKSAWPRVILRWVIDREVFSDAHEWGQIVHKKDSCWSVGMIYGLRELSGVSIVGSRVNRTLQMILEPTLTVSWLCGR
jgi:hypothetical protein